ncbi:hypothetical protein MTR67_031057, partial [Solanum verrucosum]
LQVQPTDHRVTHGPCWWSVVRICNPCRLNPKNHFTCRPTAEPTDYRSGHGPWSVSMDQTPFLAPTHDCRLTSTDHQ